MSNRNLPVQVLEQQPVQVQVVLGALEQVLVRAKVQLEALGRVLGRAKVRLEAPGRVQIRMEALEWVPGWELEQTSVVAHEQAQVQVSEQL